MAIRIVVAVAMLLAAVASATPRSKQVYDYNIGQFAGMAEEEVDDQVGSCYIPEYDMINPKYKLAVDKYIPDAAADDLPQWVDWRTKGAVTRVKRQGECGACWAFSAAAAIESLHYIDNGYLIPLSVQQIVDCTYIYGGCEGGNAASAFNYAMQDGLVSWNRMPYQGRNRTCRFQLDPIVLISDYDFVKPNNTLALMRAVAVQPVVVALYTNETLFRKHKDGVFRGPCEGVPSHQATLVGYGTTAEGIDYWTVKNSWGTRFAEQGYIRIERGYEKEGGLCGILQYSVYPIGPVTVED